MIDFSETRKLVPAARKAVLVTDSHVDPPYGDAVVRDLERTGLVVDRLVVPAGEREKTIETYARLVRAFADLELTRTDVAVALGGGVITDLTGFAAATYLRGIAWVAVPTTLLGMVDASVGGKTGVDLPEGKNLIGAFWKPLRTLRNPAFLSSLPVRELKNGYAEMIKTAVLFDEELFNLLAARSDGAATPPSADLIERCVAWKERIVAEDFREGGRRKLLNLGHTFGHAYEKVSDFAISHGEAVALGMRLVGRDLEPLQRLLDRYGYAKPEALPYAWKDLVAAMAHDKKRSGDRVTLVVPERIGCCRLVDVPLQSFGSCKNRFFDNVANSGM